MSGCLCKAPRCRAGTDFGRECVPPPPYFLCFAKESRQRKATPGRPPVRRLWRRWSLALLASPGRPGMARRLRRRLAGPDCPRAGCDAQRALWGPNPVKRSGLRVLTGFGADLTSLPTISLTPIPTYIASLTKPSAAVLARRTTADSTGSTARSGNNARRVL